MTGESVFGGRTSFPWWPVLVEGSILEEPWNCSRAGTCAWPGVSWPYTRAFCTSLPSEAEETLSRILSKEIN